jgi:isovaleryl-CoA dehydrogenase
MTSSSFQLSEEQRQILDTADRYAREQLHPLWRKMDEEDWYPQQLMPQLGKDGWIGITVPCELGGAGMDFFSQCLVSQAFNRHNYCAAAIHAASESLCLNNIFRNGSEELVEKYIPDMITGEKVGGIGITEPGAGSDAIGSMATTARREGDKYILNGRKMFTSNGPIADLLLIYAKTDKAAGASGVSAFVVDTDAPGFSTAQSLPKMGYRGQPIGEMVMDDCEVPIENLIGQENKGVAVLMSGLDLERVAASFWCLGVMERAMELALDYAKDRVQFGKPIASFQLVQAMLADMHVLIETTRQITYAAAATVNELEKGGGGRGNAHKIAATAFLHSGQSAMRVVDMAAQIFGGYSLITENEVNFLYRAGKLMEIGGGTTQIRKLIIAEELLRE